MIHEQDVARRRIVIGNWKMHGSTAMTVELLASLRRLWTGVHAAEVVICPTHVHLEQAFAELGDSNILLGAQDVSRFEEGAYTGDVSAAMLHDVGCQYALVGHSERRRYYRETNAMVARKFEALQQARLTPVLCVGETLRERERGVTQSVIGRQLDAIVSCCGMEALAQAVIGYEPVWAIGTGLAATPEQAQAVHEFIRSELGTLGAQVRIIYGGSVTAVSAADLFEMPDIDGALVGGASLKAHDFYEICQAAEIR